MTDSIAANNTQLKFRYRYGIAFITILTASVLFLFIPRFAIAGVIGDTINKWLAEFLSNIAQGFFNQFFQFLKSINVTSVITNPWNDLMGGSGAPSALFQMGTKICNGIIKPIAHSLLACMIILEFLAISRRISQNNSSGIEEIGVLFVYIVIFIALINNADQLCGSFYDDLSKITTYITGPSELNDITFSVPSDSAATELSALVITIFLSFFVWLLSMAAYVVSIVMGFMRALQLYIYMTFAPIPFALLGHERTRSMGIGFVKNFAALVLSGSIMVFILIAFPMVLNVAFNQMKVPPQDGSISASLAALEVIALCILLIIGLVKSGTWARQILGD